MGFLVQSWPENWHRSRLFRVLSLGGYVAFDLPRVTTGSGAALLVSIAATHVYLVAAEATPWYFVAYVAAVAAVCLLTAGALWFARSHVVAQGSWYAGSGLSVVIVGVDIATRVGRLPGMTALTGRWDVAPATFALAFACAFLALHASVLLGINVAYPHRQRWED